MIAVSSFWMTSCGWVGETMNQGLAEGVEDGGREDGYIGRRTGERRVEHGGMQGKIAGGKADEAG